MAYYERVLQPGETIHFMGRLHWLVYASTLAGFAATLFTIVAGAGFAGTELGPVYWAAVGLALAATLLAMLRAAVARSTTEMVVTDRRVIFKTGLVSRRTMEMNITKIESVDVRQTVPGRVFGYGQVMIRGTGSTFEPLRLVADPVALRNAILAG